MCGIAGILSTHLDLALVDKLIFTMQKSLQHRGPDDQGVYCSANLPVALAHTRLSILDLSPAGHQPMRSDDGRYWITFNGEIYNFRELRGQLESQGDIFYTGTDTEVILRLYQRYGTACLDKMRGMFAFAIWDQEEKSCFIARDPLGIKPLYYWQSGSQLIFASELRALMASGLPPRELSAEGLYGYFVSGSVPEPLTLVENVYCLPAGNWLRWKQGELTQQRYWDIHFSADKVLIEDAGNIVRSALIESVQNHYASDVPVGVFLSGGIDSTALVALSRQFYQGSLNTYSIAFEDPKWNEGDLARRVSQIFDTHHTEHVLTATEGCDLFPKFLKALDQPSIDGFNSFCVSQIAHSHGQKVVLSGLGGDELFGGYPSFKQLPKMLRWGRWAKQLDPFSQKLVTYLSQSAPSLKWRRIGDYLQQPSSLSSAYRSLRGIFSHTEAIALVQQFLPGADLNDSFWTTHTRSNHQPSLADDISELELSCYMRNQLLRDSDVMSMACGLELRVPFVDRVLIEKISGIPSAQRLAYGKQLLVQAVPEIPDWIVNRPKRGFSFPFDQWFSDEWSDLNAGFSCPEGISLVPWYRRWSLTVLQYWLQEVLT
jgi:asparagine synthase (glutamine-hydrolysing)